MSRPLLVAARLLRRGFADDETSNAYKARTKVAFVGVFALEGFLEFLLTATADLAFLWAILALHFAWMARA